MLNALKMNRKAFTRKENPIPTDKNQTYVFINNMLKNVCCQKLVKNNACEAWDPPERCALKNGAGFKV